MAEALCYWTARTETTCPRRRGCRSCLTQPGCAIGIYGDCQAKPDSYSEVNYRKAFEQNLTLPEARTTNPSKLNATQYWQFPALNATYCSDDDAVCKDCIANDFWVSPGFAGDSRFCVGAGGCVCVSNCENGRDDGGSIACPPEDDVTGSSSQQDEVTGSTSEVAEATQCRYSSQDKATGCQIARTCESCLQTTGCRVGTDGFCEVQAFGGYDPPQPDYYVKAIEYNLTLPVTAYSNMSGLSRPQSWQFPASQVKYCPPNDAVCQDCIANNYWLVSDTSVDSRFCVGANGCVCIAICSISENFQSCWTGEPEFGPDSAATWRNFTIYMVLFGIGCLVAVAALCAGAAYCCERHEKRKQTRRQAPVARIVNGSPTLTELDLPYAMQPTTPAAASSQRTAAQSILDMYPT